MNKTKIKLTKLPEEFEVHVADRAMTWQEAMDYAKSIGMRLPNKFELQVIAESTDEFNDLNWTWSSSTLSSRATGAWLVYLYDGTTNDYYKTTAESVLCVSP